MTYQLHVGRCEDVLKTLPDNSVDAIVTDPPYGLSFMNHKWDYDVPTVEQWQECLRVLKPGGHLLAFGGSRTYHRLVVNVEDAGFEIRDQILWIYGSGFPKSQNLDGDFDGWGTALKPAHEPIVMARKPFKGTVSANALNHGTGALNIKACRIPHQTINGGNLADNPHLRGTKLRSAPVNTSFGREGEETPLTDKSGRWPANIIHDGSDEVIASFPDAKGQQGSLTGNEPSSKMGAANCYGQMDRRHESTPRIDSSKSAARFFYCAKVKSKERDEGLERFIATSASDMTGGRKEGSVGINDPRAGAGRTNGSKNNHPTVKPIALMSYLCRLITPPGGTVLDPWMGSGSTGRAAIEEGFNFIGIDLNPDYVTIASARIAHSFKKTTEAA